MSLRWFTQAKQRHTVNRDLMFVSHILPRMAENTWTP